jgi:hypothetical protein
VKNGEKKKDNDACPHPDGYHEWVAENMWVLTLQLPAKQTPEEDTASEVAMDFGIDEDPYAPEEDDY